MPRPRAQVLTKPIPDMSKSYRGVSLWVEAHPSMKVDTNEMVGEYQTSRPRPRAISATAASGPPHPNPGAYFFTADGNCQRRIPPASRWLGDGRRQLAVGLLLAASIDHLGTAGPRAPQARPRVGSARRHVRKFQAPFTPGRANGGDAASPASSAMGIGRPHRVAGVVHGFGGTLGNPRPGRHRGRSRRQPSPSRPRQQRKWPGPRSSQLAAYPPAPWRASARAPRINHT